MHASRGRSGPVLVAFSRRRHLDFCRLQFSSRTGGEPCGDVIVGSEDAGLDRCPPAHGPQEYVA